MFSEALRFCLVFSGALRFCLENCPPETGATSAAEGVDITLNSKQFSSSLSSLPQAN